jgi:site-specific DNA recombinase
MAQRTCPFNPGDRVWGYGRDSGGISQQESVASQRRGISQQESVASQRRAIKEYCHKHQLVLVYFFADEEKVGSTTVGRDALEDLLYMAKQEPRPVEGMIFWSLARLARHQLDSQFIKIDLRRRGYVIHSMTDDIPDGEFAPVVEALIDWKNERFLKDLSKEVKRGLADLAKKGFAPGGFPPRGYLAEKVQIGTKRDGTPRIVQRWVPDPETWDRCRQAWELRANGASYREAHERTHILGSIGSYATFFRNRIYTGTLIYGGEVYEDFVPRLIPDEWFERVQAKRQKRFQHTPRHRESDYLLSGLLYCGARGEAMGGDSVPARADAGDGYKRRRYQRYVCLRWKSRRDCDCEIHYVNAKAIEGAILDKVVEDILQPEHLLRILKDAQPDEAARQELERDSRRLQTKLADNERIVERLLDAVERSGYSTSLEARLGQRERERAELQTELAAVRRRLDRTETEVPLDVVEDFCYHVREVLETGDVKDVRALLRTFILRIEIDRNRGRIIYTFP